MDVTLVYYCSKADPRDKKIKGIGAESMNRLHGNKDAYYTAVHIKGETGRCFDPKDQSRAQDEVLEQMRRAVCLPEPKTQGVTIQEVSQVATDLGKKRLECE